MTARVTSLLLAVVTGLVLVASAVPASAQTIDIWFPVQPPVEFPDSYGDSRGDHTHQGIDIMADQMQQVYAAQSGSIAAVENQDCHEGEYCSSFYILVSGDDGNSYFYVHLNNDTPGRPNGCDGVGGVENALSPRLVDELNARGSLEGVRVTRGEHIGYIGSSGNAGCSVDHLHFEMWDGHGWGASPFNPYSSLRSAYDAGRTWGPDGAPPAPGPHGRVAGVDRVGTSIALSRHSFSSASTVVIAPGESFAEALVASPLAAKHGAPILLVWNNEVPDALTAEIRRIDAKRAIVIGGTDRVSARAMRRIAANTAISGDTVARIRGRDRFTVAANVARAVMNGRSGPVSPLLALGDHPVTGREWPDALAASVLGARQQVPILLTEPTSIPDATKALLRRNDLGRVRVIGGYQAISAAVEEDVRNMGHGTRRLAGATRFDTALHVADEMITAGGVGTSTVYLATGLNFPDALAAGPALAQKRHVMLLVAGNDPNGAEGAFRWLRARADEIGTVIAIGGPVATSDPVLDKAASYMEWPS